MYLYLVFCCAKSVRGLGEVKHRLQYVIHFLGPKNSRNKYFWNH